MENIFKGYFGIERETLRIDKNGRLARTPHPFVDDPGITRDFCENQIELVTPVCESIEELMKSLDFMDCRVREKLSENGEGIWLYSNPPYFESEDEIPIANFTGTYSSKRKYREVLQTKYGKKLMLFSGIHFNFSFPEELLSDWNESGQDPSDFKNNLYLRLYKQLMKHSWLLVMLTASSSYYDKSLDYPGKRGIIKSRYSSLRNSERGYWNHFVPVLDHSSIGSFVSSIKYYVQKKMLYSASELYLPVRLKPRGLNSLENLVSNGVDHIELRMFDLDPSSELGIDERNLRFTHLFMLYLLSLPDFEFTPQLQEEAIKDHKLSALALPDSRFIDSADKILDDMKKQFEDFPDVSEIIDFEKEKLERIRNEGNYDKKIVY